MKLLEERLRTTQKYTNFEIQQIIYLVKTFSADISKSVLLAVLFHDHLGSFAVVMISLFLLRSNSGGLHFQTYLGCLAATTCYFVLAILLLPKIPISFSGKVLCMIVCMIVCDRTGPVVSKYRPPLSPRQIEFRKNLTILLIFAFIIILYMIPEHPYTVVGFWVIILHSCQLLVAKLIACKKNLQKGGHEQC